MNINEFIASGVIEDYCLGIASEEAVRQLEAYCQEYPGIQEEVEAVQQALNGYAQQFEQQARPELKAAILLEIDRIESEEQTTAPLLLSHFKEISADSDLDEWLHLTKELHPPEEFDIHLLPIYDDGKNLLFVGWVNDHVPPEVHTDELESFFILEGSCECTVGDKKIRLQAGEYLSIPLYVNHHLRVTSDKPVKAILQRKMVA